MLHWVGPKKYSARFQRVLTFQKINKIHTEVAKVKDAADPTLRRFHNWPYPLKDAAKKDLCVSQKFIRLRQNTLQLAAGSFIEI